jgi:hypothetical protein
LPRDSLLPKNENEPSPSTPTPKIPTDEEKIEEK